jgi:hypothetical protein
MISYTIHHLLELFESHIQFSGASAGTATLYFDKVKIYFENQENKTLVTLFRHPEVQHELLTACQEARLRMLDRKAKGCFLTPLEDEEFEYLLNVKRKHGALSTVVPEMNQALSIQPWTIAS